MDPTLKHAIAMHWAQEETGLGRSLQELSEEDRDRFYVSVGRARMFIDMLEELGYTITPPAPTVHTRVVPFVEAKDRQRGL